MTDTDDYPVLDADVRLDDAEEGIEQKRVGDDEIERFRVERGGRLSHAVTNDLAAAEFDFVAIASSLGDEVALDLNEEIGIRETDTIADRGTEHLDVLPAGEVKRHGKLAAD